MMYCCMDVLMQLYHSIFIVNMSVLKCDWYLVVLLTDFSFLLYSITIFCLQMELQSYLTHYADMNRELVMKVKHLEEENKRLKKHF